MLQHNCRISFLQTPISVLQNSILSVKFDSSFSWQRALNAGSRMYFTHSVVARASLIPPAVGHVAPWWKTTGRCLQTACNGIQGNKSYDDIIRNLT